MKQIRAATAIAAMVMASSSSAAEAPMPATTPSPPPPPPPNEYYYEHWCNQHDLQYLDDALCQKQFPSTSSPLKGTFASPAGCPFFPDPLPLEAALPALRKAGYNEEGPLSNETVVDVT